MPIFQIKNKKVAQVLFDLNYFSNEAALRDFFADNLEDLLGMRFWAKEYSITDGRIDTLAIDETNAPVIIEYKWGENNTILTQGLFYFDWLKENRPLFNLLVENRFGKKERVNWDNPRVILIAQGFDRYTLAAVRRVKFVELIKYVPYQQGILFLETVHGPEISGPVQEENGEEDRGERRGIEYHLHSVTNDVKKIFYTLQEKIISLPGVSERAEQKTGITYRATKSFAYFKFGRTYIDIQLREPKYRDPKRLVRDITHFRFGYKGAAKIRSLNEVDYMFDLIKQSYESTL